MDNRNIIISPESLKKAGTLYSGNLWMNNLANKINVKRQFFKECLFKNRNIPEGVFADVLLTLSERNNHRLNFAAELKTAIKSDPTSLDSNLLPRFEEICFSIYGHNWKDEIAELLSLKGNLALSEKPTKHEIKKLISIEQWKKLYIALQNRVIETEQFISEMLRLHPHVQKLYDERE